MVHLVVALNESGGPCSFFFPISFLAKPTGHCIDHGLLKRGIPGTAKWMALVRGGVGIGDWCKGQVEAFWFEGRRGKHLHHLIPLHIRHFGSLPDVIDEVRGKVSSVALQFVHVIDVLEGGMG